MGQDDWNRSPIAPPSWPAQHPRTTVAYRRMGWIAGTFHFTMMVCTMGLWTPVYLMARRGRRTVTRVN